MRYVVDASVAAKWVIPEAHSDKAIALLDEQQRGVHDLLAPDWLLPEVANVLGKAAVVRGLLSPDEAVQGFAAVLGLPLRLFPSTPLTAQALQLAIAHHKAVYDCLYIALAINQNCQMITADEPIIKDLAPTYPFLISLSALSL